MAKNAQVTENASQGMRVWGNNGQADLYFRQNQDAGGLVL